MQEKRNLNAKVNKPVSQPKPGSQQKPAPQQKPVAQPGKPAPGNTGTDRPCY